MRLNNLKEMGQVYSNPNDRNNYNRYIKEISKLGPLTREEEQALFKEYKMTGNPAIKEKICKHNLLFVFSVAKRYASLIPNSTLTLEDLIDEGNLGLCIAVDKFDYETGNKFISYAVWWIRQQIIASIQDNYKTIRLPNSIRNVIRNIEKKESELVQQLGREVTSEEIFHALSDTRVSSPHVIDELLKMNSFESSLNKTIRPDEQIERIDLINSDDNTPHESLEVKEREDLLNEILSKLPDRVQNYMTDYFGLGGAEQLTLKQMGEKYDCTASGIKQTIDKYLRRMKYNNRQLGKYLFPTPDYSFEREWRKRNKEHDNTTYLL